MLRYRYVPLAQLARMRHDHASVMMALYSFADEAGVCWPSLRTLGKTCDKPLSSIQVAIKQMVSLGYITVERGRSFVYRISAHLLAPPKPRLVVDNSVDNSVDKSMESPASGTQSPAGWTEGKTKEKQQQDSKTRGGEVPRRVAPLADSKAGDTTTDVSLDVSEDPPREHAATYDRGIVAAKRRNMLIRLNGAAEFLLRGPVRAEALDLVERAHQIADDDEAWKHRSRPDKAALDALKRLVDSYQENGSVVPCRPVGYWRPVDGEVFTADEKAEIDRRLHEQFLADEQERRARRRAGRLAA